MPIALAGLASVLWGAADFFGGFASSAWRAERVAGVSQAVGLVLTLAFAPVIAQWPVPGADLAWGGAAGAIGAAGATLLYRSLAIGPMNVAAPTVAVVAAVVPTRIGLLEGERPGPVSLAGVALAVVAVALVGGASAPGPTEPRASTRVLLLAAGAGLGLGLANVALSHTSVDSGLWPVVATKVVAGTALWSFVLATRARDVPASRRGVGFALVTGLFDACATASIAIALQRGSLVLVSVLGSLFPAATVLLARVVLDERIARLQALGLVFALVAVAMIVGG
ncbi:MAG: EamA family transporter [Actinomycetota bacterium]